MTTIITTQDGDLVFNPTYIFVSPCYSIGSKWDGESDKPTGYNIVAFAGGKTIYLTKEFNPRCEAYAKRIVLRIREEILSEPGRVADVDVAVVINALYGEKAKELFKEDE